MLMKMVGRGVRKAWIVADNCRLHKKAGPLAGIAGMKVRQAECDHGGRFTYVVKFLPAYSVDVDRGGLRGRVAIDPRLVRRSAPAPAAGPHHSATAVGTAGDVPSEPP
jgi:hypothetical protein